MLIKKLIKAIRDNSHDSLTVGPSSFLASCIHQIVPPLHLHPPSFSSSGDARGPRRETLWATASVNRAIEG